MIDQIRNKVVLYDTVVCRRFPIIEVVCILVHGATFDHLELDIKLC